MALQRALNVMPEYNADDGVGQDKNRQARKHYGNMAGALIGIFLIKFPGFLKHLIPVTLWKIAGGTLMIDMDH